MSIFLKKEDTINSSTSTYYALSKISKRTENYLEAYKRAYGYELALMNLLKTKGSLSREEFDFLESYFYHSELGIEEIIDEFNKSFT
jgi:hypothetical protein